MGTVIDANEWYKGLKGYAEVNGISYTEIKKGSEEEDKMVSTMSNYSQKYNKSTKDFIKRYKSGEIDMDSLDEKVREDYRDWVSIYDDYDYLGLDKSKLDEMW